jgi:hypothetical protein
MSGLRRFYFAILIFSLIYSVVLLIANLNINKFFQSEDFNNNILLLSFGDVGIEKALIYPLYNSLLLPIIEPVNFMLIIWTLVPTILIYTSVYIIRIMLKEITNNKSLILVFILSCICFFSSLIHLLFFEFIPTAHLLFQSVASVFFLLTIWLWNFNRKFSIIFFLLSLTMHYAAILYLIVLLLCKNLQKNRFSRLRLLSIIIVSILLYYALFIGFSIIRMETFTIADMPSMGVESIAMLYSSTLVASLGVIFQYLFFSKFADYKNIKRNNQFYKNIYNLYAYSLVLLTFSLVASISSPGIGYRIGFLVYVWSPLLIFLLPVIGILLLAALLKNR